MSKQVGLLLVVVGIVLMIVGILLFIPQSCISVMTVSVCYSPYAGIGMLTIIIGIVMLIIGAIVAATADRPQTPQYMVAPMMAPVMPYAPQYAPPYAPQYAPPQYAPAFAQPPVAQAASGFCPSCGSANPGTPVCRFCARPTG